MDHPVSPVVQNQGFHREKKEKVPKFFFECFHIGSALEHPLWDHADPIWSNLKKKIKGLFGFCHASYFC